MYRPRYRARALASNRDAVPRPRPRRHVRARAGGLRSGRRPVEWRRRLAPGHPRLRQPGDRRGRTDTGAGRRDGHAPAAAQLQGRHALRRALRAVDRRAGRRPGGRAPRRLVLLRQWGRGRQGRRGREDPPRRPRLVGPSRLGRCAARARGRRLLPGAVRARQQRQALAHASGVRRGRRARRLSGRRRQAQRGGDHVVPGAHRHRGRGHQRARDRRPLVGDQLRPCRPRGRRRTQAVGRVRPLHRRRTPPAAAGRQRRGAPHAGARDRAGRRHALARTSRRPGS